MKDIIITWKSIEEVFGEILRKSTLANTPIEENRRLLKVENKEE